MASIADLLIYPIYQVDFVLQQICLRHGQRYDRCLTRSSRRYQLVYRQRRLQAWDRGPTV